MLFQTVEPIECELRQASADPRIFHLIELKTGKEKVVSFGRLFPLKSTKRFISGLERELRIRVINKHDFFRAIRKEIKGGNKL